MKILSISAIILATTLSTFVFTGCGEAPKSDNATTADAKSKTDEQQKQEAAASKLTIDVASSKVGWVGSKKLGDKHNGFLGIKSGMLDVKDGALVGGKIALDMDKLTVVDITDPKKNGDLVGHLKGEDFFDAKKFPDASFEILKVEKWDANAKRGDLDPKFSIADPTHAITGNLMMKGVTKSITFPAKVSLTDTELKAQAKFNIKRFDWNINYGSKESAENKIINNEVNLELDITAKK